MSQAVQPVQPVQQTPARDPLQDAITSGMNEGIAALPAIRSSLRDQEASDRSLSTFVTDIPLGVAQGIRDFNISAMGLVTHLATGESVGAAQPLTKTWTGDLADAVTQFVYGFVPTNRALGALGMAAKAYRGNALLQTVIRGAETFASGAKGARTVAIAKNSVAGMVTQFVGFDEHEERLSNVLEHMPVLGKPVFSYLAAKPGDTWAEARFKSSVEGLGLGLATDGLLAWVGGLKKFVTQTQAGNAVGAKAALEETTEAAMASAPLLKLVNEFGAAAPQVSQDQLRALQRGWVGAIHSMGMRVEDYLEKFSIKAVKAGEELPSKARLPAPDALPLEAGGIQLGSRELPRSAASDALPLDELPAPIGDVAPFAHTVGDALVPGPSRKGIDVGLKTDAIELAEIEGQQITKPPARVASDSVPLYTEPPKVEAPFTLTFTGPEGAQIPVKYASRQAAATDVWETVRGTDAMERIQAALAAGKTVDEASLPSSLKNQGAFVTEVVRSHLGIPDAATNPTGFQAFKRRYRAGIKTLYQALPLEDAPRGRVDFLSETHAVISLFRGADLSTLWHESFHVWRRFGMPSEMEKTLAKAFNVSKDAGGRFQWTVEAEEMAVKQFEAYLASGQASKETGDAFSKMSDWLKAIYRGVDDSPLTAEVSPQSREVFEKMMSGKLVKGTYTPATELTVSQAGDVLYQRGKFSVPQRSVERFATALKTATTPEELQDALNENVKTWVNYNRMELQSDAEGVLRGATALIEEQFQQHVGKRITLSNASDIAMKLAEEWALDGRGLANAVKDAKGTEGVAVRLIAYRNLLKTTAEDAARLAPLIRDGKAGDMTWERFTQEVLRPFVTLRYQVKALETSSARTLSFGRVAARRLTEAKSSTLGDVDVDKMLDAVEKVLRSGSSDADKLVTQIASAAGDASRLQRTFQSWAYWQSNKKAIATGWLQELWMNNILSGARTLTINPITQVFSTFLNPAERVIGGVIRGTVLNDPSGWAIAKRGMRMYYNLGESLVDSVRFLNLRGEMADGTPNPIAAAAKTLWYEQPLLTSLTSAENDMRRITADSASEFFGVDPAHVLAKSVGYVGSVVRTPSRVLSATDELVKQLNYRSYLRDMAVTEGFEAGLQNDSKAMSEFVADYMRNGWNEAGGGTSREAVSYAERVTFTKRLAPGSLGEGISNLADNVPGMRFIFPFVRTPTNIIKEAITYTPGLNLVYGDLKQAFISGTKEARADATGRLATSSALLGATAYLCINGRITGAGPQDARERELLASTGWKSFSIVTDNSDGTKTYMGYNRLDPIAIPLGMMADLHYYHRELPERDRKAVQDSLLLAVAHQIQSKSYLSGLGMVVSAASGDERSVQKLSENFAGSFLVPNFVQQQGIPLVGAEGSEYLQEAHTFFDSIKRRLPGFNNPKRNILGEPIPRNSGFEDYDSGLFNSLSPVAFSKSVDDKVKSEMVSLGHSFTAPPKRYKTLDLTTIQGQGDQTAYDRLLELRGKAVLGGHTLAEALNTLVSSSHYQAIPHDETDVGDTTPKRAKEIALVISKYHAGALKQLLKEFPQINLTVRAKSERMGTTSSSALLNALTR